MEKLMSEETHEQIRWWRWRTEFHAKVLEHDMFSHDSTALYLPALDLVDYGKEYYEQGMTTQQAYEEVEKGANYYGW